jgi:amino acid permease
MFTIEKATRIIIPPDTFKSDFASLLNNKRLSDIVLKVEGNTIYAHKTILAGNILSLLPMLQFGILARSQHFEAMFYGGLKESRQEEVELLDIPYKPFLSTLHYIYRYNNST